MAKAEALPWIAALKVGDPVYVVSAGHGSVIPALTTVGRISPTGRVTAGGKTFNPDGTERTSSPLLTYALRPWSPEAQAAIEEKQAHGRRVTYLMRDVNWRTISRAKVQEICAILDRPDPEQEAP